MKKIKTIALALASMIAASFVLAGCGETGNSGNGSSEQPITNSKLLSYTGTHDMTATDTDIDLVKNGATEYKIVTPSTENMKSHEVVSLKVAKDEFTYFFKKATGISMRAETARITSHDAEKKYIVIGDEALAATAGIELDKEALGKDGVRIVTKDQTVYLLGGSWTGVIYAVYDFLQIMFNYEVYYGDCYVIDEVQNIKLKNFNVTDIPDIPVRFAGTGTLREIRSDYDENKYRTRFRMNYGTTDVIMKTFVSGDLDTVLKDGINGNGTTVHNTSELLPKANYPTHPKWFGDDGTQICYAAHGDSAEFEAMAQEISRKMSQSLQVYTPEEHPEKCWIGITVEDGGKFCTCDVCAQSKSTYGTDSAVAIKLCNRVNAILREWMNQPENADFKRDDLKVFFFAYNSLSPAPVKWDEATKKYVPIDDSVALDDGVGVYFAVNSHFTYSKPITDEANVEGVEAIRQWADISNDIMYWTYSTNYSGYFYFYDVFNFYTPEAYQHIAANHAFSLYNQGQTTQRGAVSVWQNLKTFLDYKLAWNSNLNYEELLDGYFEAMFKEAAPAMKRMFYAQKTQVANIYDLYPELWTKSDRSNSSWKEAEHWPYGTMKEIASMADAALKMVEHYKTSDPELYEKLYKRIEIEWMSPATAILDYYQEQMPTAELDVVKARYKKIATELGILQTQEGKSNMASFVAGL